MNLIHRERRIPAVGATLEPFGLMRNLMRWDPFRDIEFPEMQGAYLPSFDIKETAQGFVFIADLPGVKQEDLDINLTGSRLTITGKRESEERKEGENFFATERSFGSFSRTFSLPEGVDPNGGRRRAEERCPDPHGPQGARGSAQEDQHPGPLNASDPGEEGAARRLLRAGPERLFQVLVAQLRVQLPGAVRADAVAEVRFGMLAGGRAPAAASSHCRPGSSCRSSRWAECP